jgi:hypothetical protein
MQEFVTRHTPGKKKVEMVLISEGGSRRITPFLSIEMQADDKIRPNDGVHQAGPVSDLADPIK